MTGLIGTTVVGCNLFLHASSVTDRWEGAADLPESRTDTVLSIAVGGLITVAIIVTAAAAFPTGTDLENVGRMAEQLEPLAGAYATAGALGGEADLTSRKFRAVWGTILAGGIVFSGLDYSPVRVIVFAQVAHSVLLPIVAVFLIYVANDDATLGEYTNGALSNALGVLVMLVVIWLGIRTLLSIASVTLV